MGYFSPGHRVQTGSGSHPPSYPMALSLGVKWPRREADHLPTSTTDVKSGASLTEYAFMAWRLIKLQIRPHGVVHVDKRRYNFIFTFTFLKINTCFKGGFLFVRNIKYIMESISIKMLSDM
jgi:hypothetical protein